jgi:CHAT domain-containing protein
LWNVDDRSTAALMERFYSGLLRDKASPGAALRSAELALRREPQWADPTYWAAFELQGDWR